jgi:hypothetical protein
VWVSVFLPRKARRERNSGLAASLVDAGGLSGDDFIESLLRDRRFPLIRVFPYFSRLMDSEFKSRSAERIWSRGGRREGGRRLGSEIEFLPRRESAQYEIRTVSTIRGTHRTADATKYTKRRLEKFIVKDVWKTGVLDYGWNGILATPA